MSGVYSSSTIHFKSVYWWQISSTYLSLLPASFFCPNTGNRLFESVDLFITSWSLIGRVVFKSSFCWTLFCTELGGVTYRLSLSGLSRVSLEHLEDGMGLCGSFETAHCRIFCLYLERLKNRPRMTFNRPSKIPKIKKNWGSNQSFKCPLINITLFE